MLTATLPGLTFGPTPTKADGNPAIDIDAGWSIGRPSSGTKQSPLDGVVELVTNAPTRDQLGQRGVDRRQHRCGTRVWLYRVTYPGATDACVGRRRRSPWSRCPASTFRDWAIVRVDGEPFPVVPIPDHVDVPPPSGLIEQINPASSGDVPCLPAGQECP